MDDDFEAEILNEANRCSDIIIFYSTELYKKWLELHPQDEDEDLSKMMHEATRQSVNCAMDTLYKRVCFNTGMNSDAIEQEEPEQQESAEEDEPSAAKREEESVEEDEQPPPTKKVQRSRSSMRKRGKKIPARKPKLPCKCYRKCPDQITEKLRQKICTQFWKLSKKKKKESKEFGHIIIHKTKRIYILYDDAKKEVSVCKHFFMSSFGYHYNYNRPIMAVTKCQDCKLGTCQYYKRKQ